MTVWWRRLRYADCTVCGQPFRKGREGGVSRRTICSEACWAQAWRDWLRATGGTARWIKPNHRNPSPETIKKGSVA